MSMMRLSSICLSFGVAITLAFGLVSCAEPPETLEGVSTSIKDIAGTVKLQKPVVWQQGKPGGTWYDTFGDDIRSFNPFSSLDGSYTTITAYTGEPYFDYDMDSREWKGVLFESFKVASDELADTMTLTAVLRSGASWSDGVPVTADDIAWNYNEMEGDKDIYPRGYNGQMVEMKDGSKQQIKAVVIDTRTVQWVFPRVMANPLLMVNSNDTVPKHIWEPVKAKGVKAVHDFWGPATPPEQLVYCGPFTLSGYTPGERIIFKNNPHYWQKDESGQQLPYINEIVLSYVPNLNAELLKFQNGELDAYALRGKDFATLVPDADKKGFQVWNGGPAGAYSAILFNQNPLKLSTMKHRLFNDKRFRKAVSSLIDRQSIIDQIQNSLAEPWMHVISESNRHYNGSFASSYSFDLVKAKALLAELGMKDVNGDGQLEDPDGKEFSFAMLTNDQDPLNAQLLNIIANDMSKAGLKATVEVVQVESISQRILYTSEWEGWLAGMSFPVFQEQWTNVWPSNGDRHYWFPSQKTPQHAWEKRIDDIQLALRYTFDAAKAKVLYDEFQQIMMEELPIIPMYRRYSFLAVSSKWGNINWDAQHSVGDDLRRVYLK